MILHYLLFVALLLPAGLLAGYTGGLFGVGGGIVLVPVFLSIFPYFNATQVTVMHCAVGTALALVIPTSIMATRKQLRANNLTIHTTIAWIVFATFGAMLGAIIMNFVSTIFLEWLFTIYLFSCVLLIIFKKELNDNEERRPEGVLKHLAAIIIGGLSVLLGIGGGTFTVPFYRFLHTPLRKAIAIGSFTGIFIGGVGTLGAIINGADTVGRPLYSIGYVNLAAFIIVAPLVMLAAPWGAHTANTLSKKKLKWIYAGFLLILAIYMTYKIT